MQRQPTPRLESSHDRHFLPRSDALDMVYGKSAFTNLTDLRNSTFNDLTYLPSNGGDKKTNKKKLLGKRDERVSKAAGPKN